MFLNNENCDPDFYNCDIIKDTATFELNGNFYLGNYESNIDANPLFIQPSNGSGIDYCGDSAHWSLQGTSPCINQGYPGLDYPATDFDGNMRIVDDIIDIGAFNPIVSNSYIVNIVRIPRVPFFKHDKSCSKIMTNIPFYENIICFFTIV